MLKSSMAAMAGGLLSRYGMEKAAAESEPAVKNVNLNSSPSTLKITDMRYAIIVKPGPSPCPIIRIDTNQGVYGLGEVRDGAGFQYAMVLKSRIVGENPLKVDFLFQKIQQFGGISRQAGGVCAVEMALWDIAGKVYNCPVYQMLGGQWRDKVRIYADTTESMDPKEYGVRAKERKAMGLTWMKMDLGINVLEGIPGTVMQPSGSASGSCTISLILSWPPRSPIKALTGYASMWPRCGTGSATTCHCRWITWDTSG